MNERCYIRSLGAWGMSIGSGCKVKHGVTLDGWQVVVLDNGQEVRIREPFDVVPAKVAETMLGAAAPPQPCWVYLAERAAFVKAGLAA